MDKELHIQIDCAMREFMSKTVLIPNTLLANNENMDKLISECNHIALVTDKQHRFQPAYKGMKLIRTEDIDGFKATLIID